MINKLVHLLERLTGLLLGGLGVSVQVGNVLVCIVMMLLGPTFIIDVIAQ